MFSFGLEVWINSSRTNKAKEPLLSVGKTGENDRCIRESEIKGGQRGKVESWESTSPQECTIKRQCWNA